MGDYASKGLANGVGIPALVLGSLGFLQSGGLGNGLFGCNNGANSTAYSAVLSQKDSKIASLTAEKYTDNKIADTYIGLNNQINALADRLATMNLSVEKRVSALEGQVSCLAQATNTAIAGINNTLSNITKCVIPTTAICPEVMPRYNSWTAPTTTTTA